MGTLPVFLRFSVFSRGKRADGGAPGVCEPGGSADLIFVFSCKSELHILCISPARLISAAALGLNGLLARALTAAARRQFGLESRGRQAMLDR